MTVDDLRAREISIREKLAEVRNELASVVLALADASRAKEQIAAEDGPNDGVYRKPADERLGNLRERAAVILAAESDRERLRAQESRLMIELERNRHLLVELGAGRVRLPALAALANIPDAAPCSMRWEDMTGDGDERVCTKCHKIARNIALIENVDPKTFLTDLNAPFHRRADGTILAGNCKEGEHGQRVTRAMGIALGIVIAIVAGVLFSLEAPKKQPLPALPANASELSASPSASASIDPTQMNIHGVWGINIRDTARDHGRNREIRCSLTTRGNEYVTSVSCDQSAHAVSAVIPADSVQRFFDAINKRRTSPDTMNISCADSDVLRDIDIRIVDGGSVLNLTVRNCSRQWFANDVPINLDPADPLDDGEVNARYDDLVHVLPVEKCFAEVADAGESAPPPSARRR